MSNEYSDVLLIDKPAGMGSTDVLRQIKRVIPRQVKRELKIGHFGTLDPFATGLLMVAFGQSCRLADLVHAMMPKSYLATGRIGSCTDTGDGTGTELVSDWPVPNSLEKQKIETHLANNSIRFMPSYAQRVPSYSAAKFEGRKLYSWARSGVSIERPPVERFIYQLNLESSTWPLFTFQTEVSSGTYIRQLWQDWAESAGKRGHLLDLRRTSVGAIHVSQAWELERMLDHLNGEWPPRPANSIVAIDSIVQLPKMELSNDEALRRFCCGAKLGIHDRNFIAPELPQARHAWVMKSGKLIGLGEIRDDAACYPQVVFAARPVANP